MRIVYPIVSLFIFKRHAKANFSVFKYTINQPKVIYWRPSKFRSVW